MQVFKKNGEFTKNAISYIKQIQTLSEGKKVVRVHPKFWTGSPRHMSLCESAWWSYIDLCKEFGLKYVTGNDAPKGGVTGDFIEIRVDRRNKFWKLAI